MVVYDEFGKVLTDTGLTGRRMGAAQWLNH
jgi:hypothetical protein